MSLIVARAYNELPSGPAGNNGGSGDNFNRRPGRFVEGSVSGGPIIIDQSRLPTCAPYTAFIGNLPFDVVEGDIRTFFQMRGISAGSVLNINLLRDLVENKSRGFGYVEFSSVEDLTKALLVSNQFAIRNRVIRIDMSDSKSQKEREPRPADSNRNWRDGAGNRSIQTNRGDRGDRESRPVSAAEVSRNWRDGATPISAQITSRNMAQRSASESVGPMGTTNWRESSKPIEKSFNPQVPVVQKNWRETAQAVVADKIVGAGVTEDLKRDEMKFGRKEIKKEGSIPSAAPAAARSWRRAE